MRPDTPPSAPATDNPRRCDRPPSRLQRRVERTRNHSTPHCHGTPRGFPPQRRGTPAPGPAGRRRPACRRPSRRGIIRRRPRARRTTSPSSATSPQPTQGQISTRLRNHARRRVRRERNIPLVVADGSRRRKAIRRKQQLSATARSHRRPQGEARAHRRMAVGAGRPRGVGRRTRQQQPHEGGLSPPGEDDAMSTLDPATAAAECRRQADDFDSFARDAGPILAPAYRELARSLRGRAMRLASRPARETL